MLRRAGHEVTLFEKLGRLGLGAHGVDFEPWPTRFRELDVPSRMFNASTWPSLVKLYDQIGVLTTPVEPSKSYSDGKRKTYLKFKDGFRPALSTDERSAQAFWLTFAGS